MAPSRFLNCESVSKLYMTDIGAATQYELSPPPGDAVSAIAFAPSAGTKLLVSSWDKKVYCYDTSNGAEEAHLTNTYEHRAPVLDVCFGASDDEAFTAGMDWLVSKFVHACNRYGRRSGDVNSADC